MAAPNDQNPTAELDANTSSWVFHALEVLEPKVPELAVRVAEANRTASELAAARDIDYATLQALRSAEDGATEQRRQTEDENTGNRRADENAAFETDHAHVAQAEDAAVTARAMLTRMAGTVAALQILQSTEGMKATDLATPAQRVFTQLLRLLAYSFSAYSNEEQQADQQVFLDILKDLPETS